MNTHVAPPGASERPRTSLANQRGAALLLLVYFSSMVLFMMSALSLQRTNLAMRAAQLSRDLAQAFWLADGALDDATARLQRGEAVVDGLAYQLNTVAGTASYTLHTDEASLSPPANGQPAQMQLARRIIADGETPSHIRASVTAHIRQAGPAQGVWANGLITAYGGPRTGSEAFLTGNLQSGLGVVVATTLSRVTTTTTRPRVTTTAAPIGSAAPIGWWDWTRTFTSATLVTHYDGVARTADLAAVQQRNSPDLNGFISLSRFDQWWGTQEEWDGVSFDLQPKSTAVPHVDGEVTVKDAATPPLVQLPGNIQPADCQGTLALDDKKPWWSFPRGTPIPTIDDGFDNGQVRDLSGPGDGQIVLCVKAIVPKTTLGWGESLMNRPPQIAFKKPTTLYLTSSQHFDISDVMLWSKELRMVWGLMVPGSPHVGAALQQTGVTMGWDVSLAAELSVSDASGQVIPGGLNIITTAPLASQAAPGLLLVKPGQFSGSVYAPQSLVVFRDAEERDWGTLDLRSIIANEAVLEVGSRTLALGKGQGRSSSDNALVPTQAPIVAWTYTTNAP